MYSSSRSLNSAVDGMSGQRHAPAALTPGKRPGYHYTEGWLAPRAELDGSGKFRPPTGIRSSDRQARSESIYRLRYTGPNENIQP